MVPTRYVLPAGSGEAIHGLLQQAARGTPWVLVRWRTEPAWFAGYYEGPGGRTAAIRFAHPDEPDGEPGAATERFHISLMQGGPEARELLQRLATLTRRWERRWRWEREGHARDIELVGLEAGLRKGIRVHADPGEAEHVMARYRAAGAHVALGPPPHSGRPGARLVYVAWDEAGTRALADAERERDSTALGRLLGYPECCIAAFVERAEAHGHTEEYLGARAAWVPRPAHRLNALMFGPGVRFISFEPCRYDCPRALEVADATAEALARRSPESVERIDRALACCLVIGPGSYRAEVELAVPERRILEATALLAHTGEPGDEERAFARALAGRTVTDRGEVERPGSEPCLLLDFAGLGAFA